MFKSEGSNISINEPRTVEMPRREKYKNISEDFQHLLDPGHTIPKNRIYYHRSYRKLSQESFGKVILSIFLQIVLIDFLIVFYYPDITRAICKVTKAVLSTGVAEELIEIVPKLYIYDNVYAVTLPGRYPSMKLAIIVAIVSLTFFFATLSLKRVIEPKFVWLMFISFINLVAAVFFIFFAGYFPYDLEIFSEMYIKTEVGIWVIIPFILTIALMPFPIKMYKKIMVILLTLGYSIIFAAVRYVVFLYMLRNTSYLFMALMFFMLGPFLDFLYIVGSYSLCLSSSGKQTQRKMERWNWLF